VAPFEPKRVAPYDRNSQTINGISRYPF